MKKNIRVFAGYQFKSSYFKRSKLDEALSWVAQSVSNDFSIENCRVDVQYEPVDVTPGSILIEELKSLIKSSDICLFEVSDLNHNVFIELGIALSDNKPAIMLRNSSTGEDARLPSDLSGIIYHRYSTTNQLKASLGGILYDIICKILGSMDANPSKAILDYIWMGHDEGQVTLIGGEMRGVKSPSNVRNIFYVQSADVYSLLEAGLNLVTANKNVKIAIRSCQAVSGSELSGNLISVGGPRSNFITNQLLERLDLPWKFRFTNVRGNRDKSICYGSKKFKAGINGDEVKTDYCMIVAGRNPFNRNSRFALFAGLYTFGVLGAVRALSIRDLCREVILNTSVMGEKWNGDNIIQIVSKVDVVNGRVITPLINPDYTEVIKNV